MRLQQATPRSRAWAHEPQPSRWRPLLGGLAWVLLIAACGITDVRF